MSEEPKKLKYCVGGQWRASKTDRYMPCHNPSTGEVIALAPQCTADEVESAIAAAKAAYPAWADTPVSKRVQVLFKMKALVDEHLEELTYLLLNKPLGVVTTLNDPDGRRVVTDLVRDQPVRLFPVGRLDINTSGLLLMTNDGDLANRLAHPSHQIDKRYLVKIRGQLTDEAKIKLAQGVLLDHGITAPARVEKVRTRGGHTWLELCIHEGRNRQVRRMCEALGYQVSRLVRIGYAFLTLGDLAPGQTRILTKPEVNRLKKLDRR